jgi:NADH:ubiquinone oxidoreductase subunit F (NADH-binding)
MADQMQLQPMQIQSPSSEWDSNFESEMKKTLRELLEDKIVENKLADFPIWSMLTKTSKITFLEQKDLTIFESYLEAMVCDYLMSIPPSMINDDTIQQINQMRMISKFNLRRSAGTSTPNKMNERTVQMMQIRQSVGGGQPMGDASKPGFIKRLFGVK